MSITINSNKIGGVIDMEYKIEDVDLKTAKNLKREICEKYKVIPIKEQEDGILVLSYEATEEAKEYLKFIYNKNIIIEEVEKKKYENLKDIIFGVEDRELDDVLIFNAIRDGASDIHIEPQKNSVYVRYRINGSLILVL